MKKTRLMSTSAVALALVLGTSSTAFADVYENGMKSCSANQIGKTRGYSLGNTWNYAPVSPSYSDVLHYNTGGVWAVRTNTASKTKGGLWMVNVDGVIDDAGTYASCVTTGTPS